MSRVSLAFMLFGAGMGTWYLGRDWEEGELKDLRIVCTSSSLCIQLRCLNGHRNPKRHRLLDGAALLLGLVACSTYVLM